MNSITPEQRLASARNKVSIVDRLIDQPSDILESRFQELNFQHTELHREIDEFIKKTEPRDANIHDELEAIQIIVEARQQGVANVEIRESLRRSMERVERAVREGRDPRKAPPVSGLAALAFLATILEPPRR